MFTYIDYNLSMCVNKFFFETQTCCRAASVLSHVLKDNVQCKERVSNCISFSLLSSHAFSNSLINLCIICMPVMYVACVNTYAFSVLLLPNKRKSNYHLQIKSYLENDCIRVGG